RLFTHNWRLKLAALALAVLVWVLASAQQTTRQWITARVEAVVRDPDFAMVGAPEPSTVRVQFRGRGRDLWELAINRPVVLLRVDQVGGRRTFVLENRMVRLPGGVSRAVLVEDIRPPVVRLELRPR
ncbi:MAG TPA: hypothetical protein VNP72_07295, partial [Longimicrobium sp.]|nr:hypothetical protein [Longimicrobium sp.]